MRVSEKNIVRIANENAALKAEIKRARVEARGMIRHKAEIEELRAQAVKLKAEILRLLNVIDAMRGGV